MSTLIFTIICIGIILLGAVIGVFLYISTPKQKDNISKSFCKNNAICSKFTDQNEISTDKVIKNFKLLDI